MWHRSGMNLTDQDRVALPNACIPSWVQPMADMSAIHAELSRTPRLMRQLTERERVDAAEMMAGAVSPVGRGLL